MVWFSHQSCNFKNQSSQTESIPDQNDVEDTASKSHGDLLKCLSAKSDYSDS